MFVDYVVASPKSQCCSPCHHGWRKGTRLTLLERTIADADRRLVILAPPDAEIPRNFRNVVGAGRLHTRLLSDVQRLRGRVYAEDGAIEGHHLCSKGRHKTPEDDFSWHIASLNSDGDVVACAWYRLYPADADVSDLRVQKCPLFHHTTWRDPLREALEVDLQRARTDGIGYAEVGGWAIDKPHRCSPHFLLLACAAYTLSRTLGNAICMATATARHSSAQILRRLGGAPLKVAGELREIPPYFDDDYGCTMELLRFDSRTPNPEIRRWVDMMRQKFATVPIVLNDVALAGAFSSPSSMMPQYAA